MAKLVLDKLLKNAEYYEYGTSADPIGSGLIKDIPYHVFPHNLHEEGPSRVIALDLSSELGCDYPATSPALLANFVRIKAGETISTQVNATSQLFYVMRGNGRTEVNDIIIPWNTGDFFVLPAQSPAKHYADIDSAFYYVHDEPLLNYLGVEASIKKFAATLFTQESSYKELQKAIDLAKISKQSNRLSVLLANQAFPQTRTITHVLWAMFGVLQANQIQLPHRHQSVAIDLAVECQPGCYTLIGKNLDEHGNIVDATREDWQPYSVFVTPPGYWHSHHNESGVQAHVIPLQDAGLHTYMRSLDIQFYENSADNKNIIG